MTSFTSLYVYVVWRVVPVGSSAVRAQATLWLTSNERFDTCPSGSVDSVTSPYAFVTKVVLNSAGFAPDLLPFGDTVHCKRPTLSNDDVVLLPNGSVTEVW